MNRWLDWADLGKELGNVVRMKPRGPLQQARSVMAQMEAYWDALPRSGSVPRRADVDPRGIEDLLPHAFILEQVAPRVARIRIAGQHLQTITGMEVRGMPVTALFRGGDRVRMGDALAALFDRPAIVTADLTGPKTGTRKADTGQMVLLPLCLDNGQVSRAMGAIVAAEGRPGRSSPLGLADLRVRPVDGNAPVAAPAAAPAFAEDQTPLAGRGPGLRLVHSSD